MRTQNPCPNCDTEPPPQLQVGDTVYGYCHGKFPLGSGDKIVVEIGHAHGQTYVVLSEPWWGGVDEATELHLYTGDPDELVEYTYGEQDENGNYPDAHGVYP